MRPAEFGSERARVTTAKLASEAEGTCSRYAYGDFDGHHQAEALGERVTGEYASPPLFVIGGRIS
jgi:hypothetical protein